MRAPLHFADTPFPGHKIPSKTGQNRAKPDQPFRLALGIWCFPGPERFRGWCFTRTLPCFSKNPHLCALTRTYPHLRAHSFKVSMLCAIIRERPALSAKGPGHQQLPGMDHPFGSQPTAASARVSRVTCRTPLAKLASRYVKELAPRSPKKEQPSARPLRPPVTTNTSFAQVN